jgi:hypothetical protein
LEQSFGRPRAEGDVEEDVGRGGLSASLACSLNDHANLLIAWPGHAELLGNQSDAAVCLGDRRVACVQSLCRIDEARIETRSEPKHCSNDAGGPATQLQRSDATLSK